MVGKGWGRIRVGGKVEKGGRFRVGWGGRVRLELGWGEGWGRVG